MNGNLGHASQRWLSRLELALGAGVVIGHNVYHRVPNEVPILFVLGWLSIRLRNGGWRAIGLARPGSWLRTVAWALAATALIMLVADGVVGPFAERHFGAIRVSKALDLASPSLVQVGLYLVLIWTFAAFGEELVYRGYLLTRAAEAGGPSRVAQGAALLAVSVLFGYGHYYKGPAGILASTVSGLVLGGVYWASGRNLWAAILAHGFRDTLALALALLGWSS